jgi:hypothetical protein
MGIFADNRSMEELTITDMMNQTGINRETIKKRLLANGIRPIRIIGTTGIYNPSVLEVIKETPSRGRPKKL